MATTSFPGAKKFIPVSKSIPALREAVQECCGCDLYLHATQGVFGEGPKPASILMIGEQPGNDEDLQGHPFVGPAGKMLDKALQEAGINRTDIFLTNAVKHFKFEERGKHRIHKKPTAGEVRACHPWLELEVQIIKPKIIVCLGATAAQALLGSEFRLTMHRGEPQPHPWAEYVVATAHPSVILRAPDAEQRRQQYSNLVADFKKIRGFL